MLAGTMHCTFNGLFRAILCSLDLQGILFHNALEIFIILRENEYNLFCLSTERVVSNLED